MHDDEPMSAGDRSLGDTLGVVTCQWETPRDRRRRIDVEQRLDDLKLRSTRSSGRGRSCSQSPHRARTRTSTSSERDYLEDLCFVQALLLQIGTVLVLPGAELVRAEVPTAGQTWMTVNVRQSRFPVAAQRAASRRSPGRRGHRSAPCVGTCGPRSPTPRPPGHGPVLGSALARGSAPLHPARHLHQSADRSGDGVFACSLTTRRRTPQRHPAAASRRLRCTRPSSPGRRDP